MPGESAVGGAHRAVGGSVAAGVKRAALPKEELHDGRGVEQHHLNIEPLSVAAGGRGSRRRRVQISRCWVPRLFWE